MERHNINFELIAIELGDEIKGKVAVNEIKRIAKATLKIKAKPFPHDSITSVRAQTVYDYVKTLEHSSLSLQEKMGRLTDFIEGLLPEDSPQRKKLLRLVGIAKVIPEKPPDFYALVQDSRLAEILENRWIEIQKCISSGAHIAAIILMGSLLEGMLLSAITQNPKQANQAAGAPKDVKTGKVKPFGEWTLNDLINVAYECGWLQRDIKDFSHELRDYRNMVHPWHQRTKNFHPDEDTCRICWEVIRAAIADLAFALANSARGWTHR